MSQPLPERNENPAQCPFFNGQGTCDGSAGACFWWGEPMCMTNMPEGGWQSE